MPEHFDLVVLGGGAAGLSAARAARRRQLSVVLVQDGPPGGDCTFTGCVPSKTLIAAAARGDSFGDAMSAVRGAVATLAASEDTDALARDGITVATGRGIFRSASEVDVHGRILRGRHVIVATGSAPLVPPVNGLGDVPFRTNEDVFKLERRPDTLAVLGGGPIGCELAQAFARLGTRVTVIEAAPRLLPRDEPDVSALAQATLESAGVTVLNGCGVRLVERQPSGARLWRAGQSDPIDAEIVLVAAGRAPSGRELGLEAIGVRLDPRGAVTVEQTMATAVPNVWAAGDVTGLAPFTHAAARMGYIAVRNAFDRAAHLRRSRLDRHAIPWVTFLDPEMAHVGMTEEQAAPLRGRVAELPLAEVDRAVTAGLTTGFVRLIAAPHRVTRWAGGGRLVGATIVAPCAGELIHEAALAIETSMFTGRLAQTVHAYPTWSIAIQQAATQFLFEIGGRIARPAVAG